METQDIIALIIVYLIIAAALVLSLLAEKKGWNKDYLRAQLKPVLEFQRKTGCRIYVGEFSAVAWAPGADAYLRDCIDLFEEYGWDWTYHAFREYAGWSVEHEGEDAKSLRPAADTPRKRVLLEGFRAK